MKQLLVRDVEESIVRKLKRRAAEHGVSTEEEHRRLLKEALNKPSHPKPSLMEYLLSTEAAPDVELEIDRTKQVEDRETGL